MNQALARLAREVQLQEPQQCSLRLAFGLACVQRVEHLLEDPAALACLAVLRDKVSAGVAADVWDAARERAALVANQHRGSNSIDGAAHAAVSATYALANALAGKALEAASYAAYAAVYGYGGYAVNDPDAFTGEFEWQVSVLKHLAETSVQMATRKDPA